MVKRSAARRVVNKPGAHSKAFKESLAILKDELALAFHWDSPSILLAIHKSKTGEIKAQKALEQELIKTKKRVVRLAADETNAIDAMRATPNREDVVFFFSGIGSAENGNGYRALNMRRELLVENRIRAVFWLTETTAAALPHHAPDFWAFRHRAVEFAPRRGTRKNALPAGALLWKNPIAPGGLLKEHRDALARHEAALASLPQAENAAASRLETLLTLAQYCWLLNERDKFSNYLAEASSVSEKYDLPQFAAWALNAKGIELYEEDKKDEARAAFKLALNHAPDNAALLANAGVATHALGKNREAILALKRAIKRDAKNPSLWRALGYVYLSTGRMEDALEALKKRRALEPNDVEALYALATCRYKNGQIASCAEVIRKIGEVARGNQTPLQSARLRIMSGRTDEARALLERSLEKNEITQRQIMRDVELNILSAPEFLIPT